MSDLSSSLRSIDSVRRRSILPSPTLRLTLRRTTIFQRQIRAKGTSSCRRLRTMYFFERVNGTKLIASVDGE